METINSIKKYNNDKSMEQQCDDNFILYDNNFELNDKLRKKINNKSTEEYLDDIIKNNKKLAKDITLRNNDIIYVNWNYYWIYINEYTFYWGPAITIRKYKLNENVNYSIKDKETKPYDTNSDRGFYWGKELADMKYLIDGNWIPDIYYDLNNYKVVHNMTEGDFIIPKLSFIDEIKKLLNIK